MTADSSPGSIRVRPARRIDVDPVAAFTADTWGDRHGDYMPSVFPQWVEADADDRGSFVATVDREVLGSEAAGTSDESPGIGYPEAVVTDPDTGREVVVAGCCQGVLLSDWEAWAQGMRVNPDCRGRGVSLELTLAVFRWARREGAAVCRNMVFSWNTAGLGQSRTVGFDPCTQFRFALPEPDATARPELAVSGDLDVARGAADPDDAWAFWTGCDTRDHLRGLAMDPTEPWAVSALTRDRLRAAAADGRLLTVHDDGVAGMANRVSVTDRDGDDGEERTRAVYGVGAWRDSDAAAALLSAVARDAASVDADETRVLIPETARTVSDVAAARVRVSDHPDFVLAADLTDPEIGGE